MLIDVGRRQKHPTTTFHFPPAARFLFLCVCVCLRWESRRQKKRERWAFTKFIASDFDAAVTHALPTNHIIQLVCMRVHHLCLYRREGGGTREKAKVNQQKKRINGRKPSKCCIDSDILFNGGGVKKSPQSFSVVIVPRTVDV